MASDYQYIMLVGGLVLLVVLCFGAFVFFMARELRVGGGQMSHSANDVTNMMILFQTMRDILTQQKDLAREFNISIDKKVNEVRRLLQSNGDVRAELERTKREMSALAARTRREMSALERRLGQVDTDVAAAVEEEAAQAEPDEIEEEDAEASAPVEILPGESESEDPSDLIERWTRGEDFDEDSAEDEPDPSANGNGHDEEVESEDTRAAYRDLLNLQPAGRMPSSSDILDAGREAGGAQYLTPIQQRVYEYSDAGLRVPEIARELGVGKGEVRLILSLRQDRGR